ncbi:MAG: amidase family protein [Burkholderiales bacterium]
MIRPAAYCGVVGFKPSFGTISTSGVYPFSPTLDQGGVFTRSVRDAALVTHSLLGFASKDAVSVVGTLPANISKLDADFERAHAVHKTLMWAEGARSLSDLQDRYRDRLSAVLNALIDEGRLIGDVAYASALAQRSELQLGLARVLSGYHAIITPPASGEAPVGLSGTGDPSFCTIWTLCGVPALTLPCALSKNGLPLGLQVVGAYREDVHTIAVWCETQLGFSARPFTD